MEVRSPIQPLVEVPHGHVGPKVEQSTVHRIIFHEGCVPQHVKVLQLQQTPNLSRNVLEFVSAGEQGVTRHLDSQMIPQARTLAKEKGIKAHNG